MTNDAASPFRRIALVLLGAGASVRFAGNKLASPLMGIPLLRRTAAIYASLPFAARIATTSRRNPSVADMGFSEVCLEQAGPQSNSIAAGVAMVPPDVDGIMVALADMPLVTVDHLRSLVEAFNGSRIVCSTGDGFRSPPALFPAPHRQDLMRLSGDQGARPMLRDAHTVSAAPGVLLDVDTPEAMKAAEQALLARQQQSGDIGRVDRNQ